VLLFEYKVIQKSNYYKILENYHQLLSLKFSSKRVQAPEVA